jgi:hypothetical protein
MTSAAILLPSQLISLAKLANEGKAEDKAKEIKSEAERMSILWKADWFE